MENVLDVVSKWSSDNHIVVIGLLLLGTAFILSFFCRTAWNAWVNRK